MVQFGGEIVSSVNLHNPQDAALRLMQSGLVPDLGLAPHQMPRLSVRLNFMRILSEIEAMMMATCRERNL